MRGCVFLTAAPGRFFGGAQYWTARRGVRMLVCDMAATQRLQVLVVTGAGVSAESGIPTFRGVPLWVIDTESTVFAQLAGCLPRGRWLKGTATEWAPQLGRLLAKG